MTNSVLSHSMKDSTICHSMGNYKFSINIKNKAQFTGDGNFDDSNSLGVGSSDYDNN